MGIIAETKISEAISNHIENLQTVVLPKTYTAAINLFKNHNVQILSQSKTAFEYEVEDDIQKYSVSLQISEGFEQYTFELSCSCKSKEYCKHKIAVLLDVSEMLKNDTNPFQLDGKKYTREGMIKRVLDERKQKAFSEFYRLTFDKNPFGEHHIKTEKSISYKLTFRNFENETGYCSCPDYKKNKLGICKHLIFAFKEAKNSKLHTKRSKYPFIEIFLDPLNQYEIAWYFPHELNEHEASFIAEFFTSEKKLIAKDLTKFIVFLNKSKEYERIFIRPEVYDSVEEAFEERILDQIKNTTKIDLSGVKANLFPYQLEGVEFAAFKKGAIIADEMGLGKTLQAISIALIKKEIFGFKRTLVICPASLKDQWKNEIEKFTDEKAKVVDGTPEERALIYQNEQSYFLIINYETVLRDKSEINKWSSDFIILDEAQKIKNYETITANAVKELKKKHGLVITGTPIENKLIDLYSIVEFLYPGMLSPIWEFSYQYCLFDEKFSNKINGYMNLQDLKERISPLLLRRSKKEVSHQFSKVTEITIPVEMHPRQVELHSSFASGVAAIIAKKFKTAFDWQKLTMLLQSMRMTCNSTYLIDDETNFSPKLIELKDVLFEKLDLTNNKRKIIIFSEWVKSNYLIGLLLKEHNIGFAELSGKVPVKKRQALIREFEQNENCRVFLSTEAGGAGLNLQVADTIINFELPWNPAKKNQRTGRIDRIGQKNEELTVINFITKNSIEMKIASGLSVKQELFDSVLDNNSNMDSVDFSDKGRAQFLLELELAMNEFAKESIVEESFEHEDENEFLGNDEEVAPINKLNQEKESRERIQKLEELETVMNKGMEFLAGMYKMSTGKDLDSKNSKVEIDKETGEVVMRFKML